MRQAGELESGGVMIIPALTIWQPHASLIMSGHKKYETRSRPCPKKYIGQRIAIHAGLNQTDMEAVLYGFCSVEFKSAINKAFGSVSELLPTLGCVLGTAVIDISVPCDALKNPGPFGDFSEGMYAWGFRDIQPFDKPQSAKGAQGFWKWQVEG
jgi:hypothetical protein